MVNFERMSCYYQSHWLLKHHNHSWTENISSFFIHKLYKYIYNIRHDGKHWVYSNEQSELLCPVFINKFLILKKVLKPKKNKVLLLFYVTMNLSLFFSISNGLLVLNFLSLAITSSTCLWVMELRTRWRKSSRTCGRHSRCDYASSHRARRKARRHRLDIVRSDSSVCYGVW